jgi:hypothetical protein
MPWIAPALASLQSQSFADFELVVVDDHSSDSTSALVASRAANDPRIRLVPNRGRGLVAALTTGLAETRAPLVARMDADDIAWPHRLEAQVSFLDTHPEIALVGAQVQPIDAAGRPAGDPSLFPTEPVTVAHDLLYRGCVVRHPTVLVRRTALEAVGGYRAVTELAEDYDLWLRLSEKFALANMPDVLLDYRVHPGQVSHGVNWRQRFARDASLIAARARRRGDGDPLQGIHAPLDFDDPLLPHDPRLPVELRQLVSAYAGARAVTEARVGKAEPDFAAMVEVARAGLFGDGRKVRGQIMALAARTAYRSAKWRDSMESLRTSFDLIGLRAISVALTGLPPSMRVAGVVRT